MCGEHVPPRALACPECGADHNSGWGEDAIYDGLDLPDGDFDYDQFAVREFGSRSPVPEGTHPIWWIAAIAVLLALIAGYVGHLF